MGLRDIGNFHETRTGHLVFGIAELVLCAIFVNLAIPSGDWWEWLIVAICFLGIVQNFGRMFVGVKK